MTSAGVAALHRWAGLIAGPLVVFLALTGAAIVFAPQFAPVANVRLTRISGCAHQVPIDRVISAARSVHASAKVSYVYLYGSPAASMMVRFADQDQVYVEGCTGRVLGEQNRYAGFFGTLEGLHKFRFLKATGMTIIGTVALVLALVLAVGGATIWWPRRKTLWRPATHLKGRARAFNWHGSIGAYACLIVFTVALTAVPLSLNWARSALFTITHSSDLTEDGPLPTLPHVAIDARERVTMQSAWEKGHSIFPGPFQWASIRIPRKGEPIEVGLVPAGQPNSEARNYAYIDPRSGSIVQLRPYDTLNLGSKLYYWALAIHTGRVGGAIVQTVLFAGMVALSFIVYFGIESYLRMYLLRRSAASYARKEVSERSALHSRKVEI